MEVRRVSRKIGRQEAQGIESLRETFGPQKTQGRQVKGKQAKLLKLQFEKLCNSTSEKWETNTNALRGVVGGAFNPALKQRQMGLYEFKTSLVHRIPGLAGLHSTTTEQNPNLSFPLIRTADCSTEGIHRTVLPSYENKKNTGKSRLLSLFYCSLRYPQTLENGN